MLNDDFIAAVFAEKAKIDAGKMPPANTVTAALPGQSVELVCGECGSEYALLTPNGMRVMHRRGCPKAPKMPPASEPTAPRSPSDLLTDADAKGADKPATGSQS